MKINIKINLNMINNMMINNMYNNNSINGMNNMGMNPIGINNQQNLMNGQNMQTIIQRYENKIKELEVIIRQKDFEISVLKQKLNNNKSNSMNMNNPMNIMNNNPMNMNNQMNMMNMMNPLNMMVPNFEPRLYLKVKFDNNEYDIVCSPKDKVSILREKIKVDIGDRGFIFNFKVLDEELSFEENGIIYDKIIEIKPVINLFFQFNGKKYSLILSRDCPFNIAISYFFIKLNDPFVLQKAINNIDEFGFNYNTNRLNTKDQSPLAQIFKREYPTITVYYYK